MTKKGAGADAVKGVQDALTYQPRTKTGKQIQQGVGSTLAPVGEAIGGAEDFLGEETLELTGSPLLASVAKTIPTAALEALPFATAAGLRKLRASKGGAPEKPMNEISDGNFSDTDIPATRGEQLQANRSGDSFDQLKGGAISS